MAAQDRIDVDAIDAQIRETLGRNRIPGATVVIGDATDVLFLRAYGHDGRGDPVTPETAFRLGSMSKAFTALVAMRLAERGAIDLDTPVTAFLPGLAPFDGSDVTLDHLLRHTSGLPTRTPQAGPAASLADHVAVMDKVDLTGAAGETHVYASANYRVAARMLEVATDTPFADLLTSEVLVPLGMSANSTSPDGQLSASGHRFWALWPRPYDAPAEPGRLATASIAASAQDMVRFLQFQLGDGTWDGTRLVAETSLAAMHRGTAEGDGFRYGLGWRDGSLRGTRAVWHGGVLPDHQGMMILLPDQGIAIALLLNASSTLPLPARPTSHRLGADVAEMVLGEAPLPFRISYATWRLGLWLALGAVLLHQLYTFLRVALGRDAAERPLRASLVDATLMISLVLGLPALLNLTWQNFARQTPDLTAWIGAQRSRCETKELSLRFL